MVSLTAGAAWISPVRAQPDAKANVPSHAAPLVDGVYQGTTERLTGAKVDGCSPGGPISLQVSDARFALPWRPLQTFDARIDAHGAFTATTANRVAAADKHMTIVPALQGHVVEGRISGEYGTRWCSYRFEAVRQ
jgi:hypothetical protein